MAYGRETYEATWPFPVTNPVSQATPARTQERGPDILRDLPKNQDVPYGGSLTLSVQYGYAAYPVDIIWRRNGKVCKSENNMARGGIATLTINHIRSAAEFYVLIQDRRANRSCKSRSCIVRVFNF